MENPDQNRLIKCWRVLPALEYICQHDLSASKRLGKYLNKQIWSPQDRQEILQTLSQLFVQTRNIQLCDIFRPLLLDIIARSCAGIQEEEFSFRKHQDICIALSWCLSRPDVLRFTLEYVKGKPGFLKQDDSLEPKKKKAKKNKLPEETLCHAAWLFTLHLGDAVTTAIQLEDLLPYISHEKEEVRWYACQAAMELQGMVSVHREQFLQKHFSEEEIRRLKISHSTMDGERAGVEELCVPDQATDLSHTQGAILETDLCDRVTCVGGVLLQKVGPTDTQTLDLLPVPSNQSNLHSLAMAVSMGTPVLLQGVVGSGKTTLVEHLARLTGRRGPPHLMKIQLGDQMDSKALLGTYRCTEVPGEFVWQPGVLTQAVTRGYWVLLEDIDYAPMEVISVLLPLLETGTLSIPGHGNNVRAAPGFHLFATQRLVSSRSGWQRQHASNSSLLDKLLTTVLVEPLSREELSQVLCTKYPMLETVIDKLLDIYFLLSAGDHQVAPNISMETDIEQVGKFLSHDGRLISTRDLMTWCSRIAHDFDVSSTATANLVFQEAVDCFVACLSKSTKRMPLGEAIGAKLNVTKVKAEYFCLKYKPEVKVSPSNFSVGRVTLPIKETQVSLRTRSRSLFSYTRQSCMLLERVAVSVSNGEPVLLVGETGTGKTSSVQYLAEQLGHKLHVINMNQQSDSADLLGGFKPVDVRHIVKPFLEDFEILFCKSFSRKQNAKFLGHLQDTMAKRKWDMLFSLMEHTTNTALKKADKGSSSSSTKTWEAISRRLAQLKIQVQQTQNALAFTFMEGTLVKAIRSGDWVLLDEINLAAMETLECLSGLLESTTGSVLLMERGDIEPVVRHPDFRLFACMNPATDVGKKDLSPGIRNRFTEFFVDELEDTQDLKILISDYLRGLSLTAGQVDGIVKFYMVIRTEGAKKLTDGTGHQPHYSLRTLCRALRYVALNRCGSVARSLYEGFCLSFLTQLDRISHPVVEQLVCQHVIGKSNVKSVVKQALPAPSTERSLSFEGYWISVGELEPQVPEGYILTPSVRANLKDLARVVSAGQHPVLIQGETSVGKTSLIKWLAQSSGNVCVRVNNHEHTDLQEYVGCYAADQSGKLVFKEGVLVEAMRKGQWVILDELNLAPTDVLEALNRLLDDNRELYIPETQETVKAHPKFMLFATQNPPGHYGGRKMLSRAFRNRFVELHFDEIPSTELQTILHERCNIPQSYAKRLVTVMLELQTRRRGSGVFAGKMGFMTLRDLFRWADRYTCPEMDGKKFYNWDKHLADQGYMLLVGRVRKPEEAGVIQEVIQKHFKCKISPASLFTLDADTSLTTRSVLESVLGQSADGFQHVVWTQSMRRMAVLIGQAIRYQEPVLLVGETGCGKTTICQMYAALYKTVLHSVNCHLHTESADFLGGLRPVRAHSEEDKKDKLFEWVDGPLVKAMKEGAMFLIDEISLADDSVLERLNSVLEPERTILLAEKGGGEGLDEDEVEQVAAKSGFHVFATMNPGGDFGKKELSPALRNRFTEIWCPPSNQRQDLIDIIEHNLHAGIHLCNQEDGTSGIGRAVMDFVDWFSNNELGKRCTVSIRDILTWVRFINSCAKTIPDDVAMETDQPTYNQLDPAVAYIHGACLVFLDGLGAGTTSQGRDEVVTQLRSLALTHLLKQVNKLTHQDYKMSDLYLLDNHQETKHVVKTTEEAFCIPPFSIPKGDLSVKETLRYALEAPGTCVNAQRVLRALQLPRPLLLEGSPGVGKTSLVSAIAKAAGRELVRINLSEQTDVTDLFGADLPVEGAEGGVFAWRDGPLLQALKAGSWIVLDELNLASQSVLEGLNACLDHRAEVYVPELSKTFRIQHEKTRLFACQNPLNQGGGRKGLPRSFLNRFTQVYVEPLSEADLMFIAGSMYPDIPVQTLGYMVKFNMRIHEETVLRGLWGQRGSPWEFNLRDLFRWCDLLLQNQGIEGINPGEYVGLVYADRMRTQTDKHQVYTLYEEIFPAAMEPYRPTGVFQCDSHTLQVGHSFLKVRGDGHLHGDRHVAMEILHQSRKPLESLLKCVEMNWMAILVGPTCAGKSSVVEMLSQLTGNRLNVLAMNSAMDTTELLGGFEQADVGRHIEEFAVATETHIQALCQHCLLDGSPVAMQTVARLQSAWKAYMQCQARGDKTTTVEELEISNGQVSALQSAVTACRKVARQMGIQKEKVQEISRLRKSLLALKERLSKAVPGQGGGAFEWMDSILVKSLQLGHWLLIDNVNFCSASVLDRLNALLEPNGVLSINERGVIDGQIPTIKPHPNFRLFLSMDSRHGEISRAMRNRGVEIYLPGEDDGGSLSDLDLRLMMACKGLSSKGAFDWLEGLHGDLREELPLGDKPNLQSLLQVCQHVVSHRNHGYGVKEALAAACRCVYVQRQRHSEAKKVAAVVLQKHLDMWPQQKSEGPRAPELGLSPVRLPSVQQFVLDPMRSKVTKNVALLVHLLESKQASDCDGNKASLQQKHSLCHLLGQTSGCTLQYTADWLQNYTVKNPRTPSQDVCRYGVDSLQEISRQVQAAMETMKYRDLIGQSGAQITDPPLDIQWNVQLLHKCVQTADPDTTLMANFTSASYRMHTLQYFLVEMSLLRKCWSRLQDAVEKDKDRGCPTVHRAVVHLATMFQALTSAVASLIPQSEMTSYDSAAKVVDSVGWLRRLYEVTAETLGTSQAMSLLPLYWKWFHNKTLALFMQQLSDQKLLAIISTLQSMLGKNDRKWKQFVKFWRSWGHPRPFQNDLTARFHMESTKIDGILRLHGSSTCLLDRAKVALMVSQRQFIIKALGSLLRNNEEPNSDERDALEKTLTLVLAQLTQHGLYSQYSQSALPEMDTSTETPAMESENSKGDHSIQALPISYVQLWPLFEYSSVMEGLRLLEGILSGEPLGEGRLDTFVNFAIQFTPMSPVHVIRLQNLTKENMKEELSAVVSSVLTRLRKSTVTDQLDKWLEWPSEQVTSGPGKEQKCFHHMTLSAILYKLLSRANSASTTTTPANVELNSPLKSHTREITQLSCISRHIWTHASTYKHSEKTTRMLDIQAYLGMLKHTLLSLQSLLPVDCIPEFNIILETATCQGMSADFLQTVSQFLSVRLSTHASDGGTTETLTQSCLGAAGQLLEDQTGDMGPLGTAWANVGLLGMHLLAPKGPVDPVEKVHIKLKILKDELFSVETELEVMCMQHRLTTGQEITEVSQRLVHPRVTHLLSRSREMTLQIESLLKQLAHRPPVSQYNQLVQDIENYLSSIGSVETLHKLTSKMQKQILKPTKGCGLQQEVELWVKSQESFVSMVLSEYQQYRDVTVPFICTVNQVLHGIQVLFHTLRQNQQVFSLSKALTDKPSREDLIVSLERLMLGIGRFPTVSADHPSCSHLAAALSADSSLSLLRAIVKDTQEVSWDPTLVVTDSVLSSSLMHLLNEARVIGTLPSNLAVTLTHILELYVLSWQQEEQNKRDKEEMEASLYRFRSQEHGDDRSEEEIDNEEFEKNFPQFTKEFADLIEPTSLEDSTVREEVDTSQSLHVSDVQMTQIFSIHQKIFKQLVNTDWYKPACNESLGLSDWTKPILSSYTAAVRLGDCLSSVLGSHVDGELLGSHQVVSAVQQHCILHTSEQSWSPLLERPKVYDIYHDSNISEVLHCVPVLRAVTDRAQELLQEWPDHPTLKQVVEIVDRIQSFPITAPVMKFLTGLELLLEKAQHWESNAAHFVSMATQLADVSGLIVQWRKLELSCWSQLLDQEIHRYQTAASKWWFHLYQLIHAVLYPQDSEETATIKDVIKSLKQFIEQSSLGDFSVRLDMLLTFHCHLVTMETRSIQQELMTVLWNLHQFYSRFTTVVQRQLDSLRVPIEKELKGFVKIARWSDINFWALKQATEKTHRTLHKHMKQFQNVLRQPVQGILGETDSGDTTSGADNCAWRDKLGCYQEELLHKLKSYKVDAMELGPVVLELMASWAPVMQKPAQLCTRFTRHWRQIVNSSQYCQLIVDLDQFTGEVIEEIHELQALEVNRSDDKAKQKSDAKHFNLRKRKALSDLFKYLAKLGLSYRKGLALEGTESDSALLVPPVDLSVAMASDPAVKGVWEGCLHYYYRCLSRKAQFTSVIVSPPKELGIGNIERSKGFSSHLFQLLSDQYRAVEHIATTYKHLQCAIGDLERLAHDKLVMCSQEEAQKWMTTVKQLIVQMTEGLSQFLVILHCCPRKQGEITAHPSPLSASQLHQMALVSVDDDVMSDTIHKIQDILKDVGNSQNVLQIVDSSLITWSDMVSIQTVLSRLSSMVPEMQAVCKLFCDPDSSHPNAFTGVLHFLCDEITSKSGEFSEVFSQLQEQMQAEGAGSQSTELSEDMRTFSEKTESLVSTILVTLQKLKKHHISDETQDNDGTGATEDAEDDEVIKDGHLVSLVHDKLQQDRQILDVSNIRTSLTDLLEDIVKGDNSHIASSKCDVLRTCLPLLHQYKSLLHHQLISSIATQRTVGKLLSVLLGVFTELATKGFCIPPELSDEVEGEGATEFCDMENAGMGEGEGVKNVSDQIEDEDQLDEAKRPEDYKKEEEENHPDVKSEENAIEMSEDFDGKVQDLEDADRQEDNEEEDQKDEEDEVEKQMGEVEGEDTDKLDEQMWGSDEEEEGENEDQKEETGPGDGTQSQPELVAKEENQDKTEAEEGNQKDDKEEPENENQQPNNLDQLDQENYDDDQVDPYHGDKMEEKQAPEDMDLPDDLNLDDASDTEEKDGQQEEKMDESNEADETKLPPEETPEQTSEEMEEDTKEQDKTEGEEEEGDDKKETEKDTGDREEEEGTDEPGLTPEDDSTAEQQEDANGDDQAEDNVQALEDYGKTSHDSECVEQSDTAQDQAGQSMENDQREADGSGQASSEQVEGHQGQRSMRATDASSEGKRKKYDRQPGKSDNERSLGSTEQKYKKLKTTDTRETTEDQQQETEEEKPSDLFEHIEDSSTHHDAQTLDVATAEQQVEQGQIQPENQQEEGEDDVDMAEEEQNEEEDQTETGELQSVQLKKKSKLEADVDDDTADNNLDAGKDQKCDVPGDKVTTATVARGPESTIHTALEHLYLDETTFDLEGLRAELESQLGAWNQPNLATDRDTERGASELWHRYELLTSSLAQDLCEQLRLVLEPSQATKLRGDYRTGKRLNMRKVIPYIASQFRKDKIWLRRTKPSKRQYQIMLAIDDSSSMVDNHSKQMAFESLALISNALTLLEVGQLAICRFGETVHSLHPFTEQFSSQSGASLLQYLTFEQKKTKIAQLLQYTTSAMLEARQRQHGSMGNPETSQLLLIVSDGRGLFMEGMEVVRTAVRQAREANVFIVFVIIDNPVNKDSILDIKVPVFKPGGQVPEIKSYMDSFPFPFYIILRDINSLPIVLSDALRQWFELVTAIDR